MPNLSVKDVPEELAERLRQRALRNHRSLQGELMAIIEQAAYEPAAAAGPAWFDSNRRGLVVGHDARGKPIIRRGTKTIEQIAAELRERFPQPVDDVSRSVDIIRELRDSR